MLNIQIELRALKACIISAAKKDIRYYLCGVMVQPRENDVICVATDGRRMTVARSRFEGYQGESFELIIPRDKVELAIKMAAKGQETVLLETDEAGSGYRLNGVPFVAIDGKYPDWRRAVPTIELPGPDSESECKSGNYNPAYLVDAAKSIGAYAGVSPAKAVLGEFKLFQNGPSGAVVQGLDRGCFVVVMPIHIAKEFETISANTGREWITDPVSLKAVK